MFKYVARGPNAVYVAGLVFDTVTGHSFDERNAELDSFCQDDIYGHGDQSILIRSVVSASIGADGKIDITQIPRRAITEFTIDSGDASLADYITNSWHDGDLDLGDVVKIGSNSYMLFQNNGGSAGDYLHIVGGSGGGGSANWGDIGGTLSDQTDLASALSGKQASLGFTAENVANKDTDVTMAANSDAKYPSQKAAKAYADTKQSALGFTPENVSNKDTDATLAANSDVKYASQKAVKAYVASQIAALVNGAPSALDTLKELSDALAADANFSVTITNALAGKASDSAFQAVKATVDAATAANTASTLVARDGFGTIAVTSLAVDSIGKSGSMQLDFGNNTIYDNAGHFSIRPADRTLHDAADLLSVYYGARSLYDTAQNVSVDWDNRFLQVGSAASVDWGQLKLNSSEGTPILTWDDQKAFDNGGNLSIDWTNRQLSSLSDGVHLDWASMRLLKAGVDSIHWGNRVLVDSGGNTILNWQLGVSYDNTGSPSVDIGGRHLQRHDSTLAADWDASTLCNTAEVAVAYWANGFKSAFGDTASRPSGLGTGDKGVQYYDTDESKQYWWDGAAWSTITSGGTAAGSAGQVQFNDGSNGFSADGRFSYASGVLTLVQSTNTTTSTDSSYAFALMQGEDYAITMGADDTANYIQSWNTKPLTINPLGTDTIVGGKLQVGGHITGGDLDWDLSSLQLVADGTLSANFDQRRLYSNGAVETLNWSGLTLTDTSTVQSMDWGARQLNDAAALVSVDWTARALINTTGCVVMSWDGTTSLLADNGGNASLTMDARELKQSNGFVAADWGSGFRSARGSTATRTGLGLDSSNTGMMFYDTDLSTQYWWTGTAWQSSSGGSGTGNINFRGAWVDSSTQYFTNDAVSYNGIVYIALEEQHGASPSDGAPYWQPAYTMQDGLVFHGGDGSAANPTYGFLSDGSIDTGMYWIGDGHIGWSCNGTLAMDLQSGSLNVVNNVQAATFTSTTYEEEKFAFFDASGNIIALDKFGYQSANFYGADWEHVVVPTNADEFKILHYTAARFNPTVTDAIQNWQGYWADIYVADDDSGNQMGEYTDLKSTLVVQDITYTSRRYGTDGDVITITYTTGATAGSEVVSKSGFDYTVQIEDGVSTATQINAAFNTWVAQNGSDVQSAVTGTGSNAQVAATVQSLSGGRNQHGGLNGDTINILANHKSNVGFINARQDYINFGNGTDPVNAWKLCLGSGGITMAANTLAKSVTFFEYYFSGDDTAIVGTDVRGLNFYGRMGSATNGLLPFQCSWDFNNAQYINGMQFSMNARGDITNGVNILADFGNYHGDIGDNYYGVTIQPNLNTVDGVYGLNFSPNVTSARNFSCGLDINMNNVNVYAGVKASVTIQDLFLEATSAGTFANGISVEFVDDVSAGSENATLSGMTVIVHIQSGVSTATQVKAALDANPTVAGNIHTTISGTGSNAQVAVGATPLTGGINGGSKKAAQFQGDVDIQGNLSFTGGLSLGAINAFHTQPLADGGGSPGSVHTIISAPTVANGVTVANADLLGVNTACLITLGDNSHTTTAFIGIAALGLPAVLSMGTGATVDKVSGATFALSLDSGATGGTADNVYLCNAILIPNGVTSVTKLVGYNMELPFGPTSGVVYGVYLNAGAGSQNWFSGSVKIGGTAGSTDIAGMGYSLDVDGNVNIANSLLIGADLLLTQQTAPAAPPAGQNKIYFKADNNLYIQDSAGNEKMVTAI